MCYNCGCGMPNNDMGVQEARQNARALLEKVLATAEEHTEKDWKP
jgi:hypothetical protein